MPRGGRSHFSSSRQHSYTSATNFCRILSNARAISSNTVSNSVVRNDRFGLITTSTGSSVIEQRKRTPSRKRRLMRLRSTAPPSARLTVKPILRPSPDSRRKKKTVMCGKKCRRPRSYTRSKSACRNSRSERGNFMGGADFNELSSDARALTTTRNQNLFLLPQTLGRWKSLTTRGNRVSPTPVCVPWHVDAKAPWRHSWSSSACESRAFSSGDAG